MTLIFSYLEIQKYIVEWGKMKIYIQQLYIHLTTHTIKLYMSKSDQYQRRGICKYISEHCGQHRAAIGCFMLEHNLLPLCVNFYIIYQRIYVLYEQGIFI